MIRGEGGVSQKVTKSDRGGGGGLVWSDVISGYQIFSRYARCNLLTTAILQQYSAPSSSITLVYTITIVLYYIQSYSIIEYVVLHFVLVVLQYCTFEV